MMRKASTCGSKADSPSGASERLRKTLSRKALGKGNSTLAQIPLRRASSMVIHRSMPRLWTTMISGANGEARGSHTRSASCSISTSMRLLVKM